MSNKEKVIKLVRELCHETKLIGCSECSHYQKSKRPLLKGKIVAECGMTGRDIIMDCPNCYGTGVLGHPLTLADVLMAIDKCIVPFDDRDNDPYIHTSGYISCKKGDFCKWDLSKNLEEQSPEVFDFLLTVLEK